MMTSNQPNQDPLDDPVLDKLLVDLVKKFLAIDSTLGAWYSDESPALKHVKKQLLRWRSDYVDEVMSEFVTNLTTKNERGIDE